jgi:hypothetical protein
MERMNAYHATLAIRNCKMESCLSGTKKKHQVTTRGIYRPPCACSSAQPQQSTNKNRLCWLAQFDIGNLVFLLLLNERDP